MLNNILRISLVSAFLVLLLAAFVVIASGMSFSVSPSTAYDFDSDGKADISVFRPTSGMWYIAKNSGFTAINFGLEGDKLVPVDYDGDGRSDVAVFRNGVWWILKSSTNTINAVYFGMNNDIPVPANFDGDTRADMAVFRPSTGEWFWARTSDGAFNSVIFGLTGDIPLPSDYDGDGLVDINVYRPSTGVWYRINSLNGSVSATEFGLDGDKPIHGDFDGDGRSDIGVWRPSDGYWYLIYSSNLSFWAAGFGLVEDIPVPADYDGDGKTDIAVFRPANSYWYRQNSSDGSFNAYPFGLSSDIPIPKQAFVSDMTTATPTSTPTRTATATPTSTFTPTPTATGTFTPTPTVTPIFTATNTASATSTATATFTATATASTSPTPPSFTCDYYASPTGTVNGSGSDTSPWNLYTALNKTTLVRNGKTLCLKGGTYAGKFISNLDGGGVVRSAPGEWAKIDGYLTTQLNGAINSSQTTLTVASSTNIVDGSVLSIDTEHVLVTSTVSGNTRTVMRGWNGTTPAAHSSGAVITHVGNQLTINGDNMTYRDLEITNSLPQRDLTPPGLDDQGCCGFYSKIRGAGVVIANRSGNSLINLIVHDNLDGIFTGSSSSNTLVYGCIAYNNGGHWTNPIEGERGAGNGMYLENSAGYSRVYETISVNNFGHGGQFFGVTGPYVGGDTQGSVFANAGSPMRGIDPNTAYRNMLFGADQQAAPTGSVTNSHFYHPAGMGYSVNFGYGAGIIAGIFTNNYVIGSNAGFEASSVTSLTMTGNKFYSAGSGDISVLSQRLPYVWNNNTYYGTGANQFRFGDTTSHNNLNFTAWKTATGFDLLSTATTSVMPDTAIVRPNTYTAGRANIVIYAPSGAASINVNLSTSGLANGQSYTIKNAFNYFGPDVASGTYNSSSPTISLPLTGPAASVATPFGLGYTPLKTCPAFCSLIVVPG